jgi:hypothetical protein
MTRLWFEVYVYCRVWLRDNRDTQIALVSCSWDFDGKAIRRVFCYSEWRLAYD